jgi:PPOX class probable F420-dependent enzyme
LPEGALDGRIAALFTGGRNIVHLASVMPDGAPHSIPLWAILEDGRIAFFTQPTSRKARNVARDPRVALSVIDSSNPYRNAQIRGRVVEVVEGTPALEVIDRISQYYIGEPFPMRSGNVYWIDPEQAYFTELPFRH